MPSDTTTDDETDSSECPDADTNVSSNDSCSDLPVILAQDRSKPFSDDSSDQEDDAEDANDADEKIESEDERFTSPAGCFPPVFQRESLSNAPPPAVQPETASAVPRSWASQCDSDNDDQSISSSEDTAIIGHTVASHSAHSTEAPTLIEETPLANVPKHETKVPARSRRCNETPVHCFPCSTPNGAVKPIAPCAEGYAQIKTILHSAAKQASQDSGDDMETGEPPQDNMDTTENNDEQEPPGDSTKDEENNTLTRGNGTLGCP